MNPVVRVDNLGKRFRRYPIGFPLDQRSPAGRPAIPGADGLLLGLPRSELRGTSRRNAWHHRKKRAGKSTLLSLTAGLLRADEGSIRLRGHVSALLHLGRSLHPRPTCRENIRTSCLLNGMTNRQVDERTDRIIEFAEIADFLDAPVRTYSSGMKARLAFARPFTPIPTSCSLTSFCLSATSFSRANTSSASARSCNPAPPVLLSSHIAAKYSPIIVIGRCGWARQAFVLWARL